MQTSGFSVVTGAFSYTGKYIAKRLLATGEQVLTLTGHPDGHKRLASDDGPSLQMTVAPFNFDNPAKLVESLRGATTLYNTYWARFARGQTTFDTVVENTRTLISAAEEAGVRRIVHISVTNASEDSALPYYRAKAVVEKAIINSGLSYAIIRPALIFGGEGTLINNIAWMLRRFPVFTIFGSGAYRLQPVFVEDVAEMAVTAGQRNDNLIVDAVGPEILTFDQLIRLVAENLHSRALLIHLPPALALFLSRLVGHLVNDVVLTKDEMRGIMSNLLVSKSAPTGRARLSDWLDRNAESVGLRYISDLKRHYP